MYNLPGEFEWMDAGARFTRDNKETKFIKSDKQQWKLTRIGYVLFSTIPLVFDLPTIRYSY